MARAADPTLPIRKKAAALTGAVEGTSCNQSSFKVGKSAFLYLGPGARGKGFKAMFRLERSMPRARKLAAAEPERYEVGSTGWVTTRFTADEPLPKSIWEAWLAESHALAAPAKGTKRSGGA